MKKMANSPRFIAIIAITIMDTVNLAIFKAQNMYVRVFDLSVSMS